MEKATKTTKKRVSKKAVTSTIDCPTHGISPVVDIENGVMCGRCKGNEVSGKTFICCLCKKESTGFGNNPAPVALKGRCCDKCDREVVIPTRIEAVMKKKR